MEQGRQVFLALLHRLKDDFIDAHPNSSSIVQVPLDKRAKIMQ